MNIFFLIFFSVIGVAGLVFNVNAGVFIGLGLVPWQIIKLKKGKKVNIIAIIISTVLGTGYFIHTKEWKFIIVYLFIQVYNYWVHLQTTKDDKPT